MLCNEKNGFENYICMERCNLEKFDLHHGQTAPRPTKIGLSFVSSCPFGRFEMQLDRLGSAARTLLRS
ncbi:hypothetical protein LP420_35275 [Massilia sp. B-10]|nr:hypothetical protein LP420_35275 [Massilia sp. B-10]UUZ57524.1 hypothetical protein LP419_34730 [Massilia sp. H-1]